MKQGVFWLLRMCGAPALVRFLNRKSLTIVLYHSLPLPFERPLYKSRRTSISPFERQIRYLTQHYRILPLDEAFEGLRNGTLPDRALAITFDDGYRNNYTLGFPVLKKYSVPATFFLTTGFVFGKKPLWISRLRYILEKIEPRFALIKEGLKKLPDDEKEAHLEKMEADAGFALTDFRGPRAMYAPLERSDIARMQEFGYTFGPHTVSHPILANVSEEHAQKEIVDSRDAMLRACGSISVLFCYPNGQEGNWTETNERVVREAGFKGALTTIEGLNTRNTDPFRLKRITFDGSENLSTFSVAVSGLRALLRRLVRG